MRRPRISVAMGTYDGARFVRAQLESIERQLEPPWELVVSDDGSSDGTVEVVRAFAARAPFPVHVHVNDTNLGFSENFLRTAKRCSGDVVAFCDQDDVWSTRKLLRCGDAFTDPDVVLAMHASHIAGADLVATGATYPEITQARTAPPLTTDPWCAVRGMSMVFRASLARIPWEARPPSHYLPGTPMHHDEWIYSLARVAGATAFIPEPLASYRQHEVNVTGAPNPGHLDALRALLTTGWAYYEARRRQAVAFAVVFGELAARETDPLLEVRWKAGADAYGALAVALDERLVLYARGPGPRKRFTALGRLARAGAYRREHRGGFGIRTLLKDAAAAMAPRR